MLLPGPEAQQLATYIGWLLHRTWGGIAAGALFVLPSLILLTLLAWLYVAFGNQPAVAGLFYGFKPAVTAIVAHAAYRIGTRTLRSHLLWAISAASFVAISALQVPFPAILTGAAVVGYLAWRLAPERLLGKTNGAVSQFTPALIDEDTPPPEHTRFRARSFARVLVAGALLWVVPMAWLAATDGWRGMFTQMTWFFTKVALLTFGGAYAVLPYVYQAAVNHYGWLTPGEMIDGLALGETTPGPLIMVVAFVAFVAGYRQALLGPEYTFAGGALAALVATWFTFLPSFLFILAGGPMVESTRGNLTLTAPLQAVTAAVTGVIVYLALFLTYHVLWPHGFSGRFDWPSACIALGATYLLFRQQAGVIPVIALSGAFGLAYKLVL